MTRTALLVFSLLSLSACRPAGDQAQSGEALAEGGAVIDGPTGKSGDPVDRTAANAVVPLNIDQGIEPPPTRAPANSTPTVIPTAFRGKWGADQDACRRPVEDRDGVMTITRSELHFNARRVTISGLRQVSPTRLSVAGLMDDPAGPATVNMDLLLSDNGGRLTRQEEGPTASFVRCPRHAGALD